VNLLIISRKKDLREVRAGKRSALFALFFCTNYNVREDGEDYFEALEQASDYFTHFWSLSVEIQFYLVAPILLHMIKPSQAQWSLFYMALLALCSFLLSITLRSQDAFSSTLCRLWQFFSGAIVFDMSKMNSDPLPISKNVDTALESVQRVQFS
ncbi:hypothetical protein PRIPAC_82003, partial [Pristionchus pacificus]